MNHYVSEFVFVHSLQRAIVTIDKYFKDKPCYYEYLIDMGFSIIVRKDNKESSVKWLFVDYADKDNGKNNFINGYTKLCL